MAINPTKIHDPASTAFRAPGACLASEGRWTGRDSTSSAAQPIDVWIWKGGPNTRLVANDPDETNQAVQHLLHHPVSAWRLRIQNLFFREYLGSGHDDIGQRVLSEGSPDPFDTIPRERAIARRHVLGKPCIVLYLECELARVAETILKFPLSQLLQSCKHKTAVFRPDLLAEDVHSEAEEYICWMQKINCW